MIVLVTILFAIVSLEALLAGYCIHTNIKKRLTDPGYRARIRRQYPINFPPLRTKSIFYAALSLFLLTLFLGLSTSNYRAFLLFGAILPGTVLTIGVFLCYEFRYSQEEKQLAQREGREPHPTADFEDDMFPSFVKHLFSPAHYLPLPSPTKKRQ